MQTIAVYVDSIEVSDRHRSLDNDAVTRLASSMKEMGLKQPITIRIVDLMVLDGKEVEGVPVLVAGRHRLEAAKQLGWQRIDCIEIEGDELQAELWEIAENLHRLDLTKEQRDEHIRRYAELLVERETVRQVRQIDAPVMSDGRRKGPQHEKGVASRIADETGLSKRTIERALNPKPAAEVIPIAARSEQDAILAQANAIVSAWNRACPEARDIAMEQIDNPVFDRTHAAR
jgi:ParB-like chromosome segregation protein Spo0J